MRRRPPSPKATAKSLETLCDDPLRPDDRHDQRRYQGGPGPKRDYGEVEQLQVSLKGPGDFVSLADKRSEKTIFEELSKARPGYGFVMEEGGRVEGTDKSHTWHIDPLDATTNFLHAIPIFAIRSRSSAKQIVAGVVYNPAADEIYVAEKGQGAFGGARGCAWRRAASCRKRDRLRHSPSRQEGRTSGLQGRSGGGDDARRQRPPSRLRFARSLLCRQRPLRRLLGARPPFLGHRRRGADLREAGGFVTDCDGGPNTSRRAISAAATSSSIARCWSCCAPLDGAPG